MNRDKQGRFEKVLELDCRKDDEPSEYTRRWRKKNPDLCSWCTKRKKAPGIGTCAQCALGEDGAAALEGTQPDLVKAMFPSDGARPDRRRVVKKMLDAKEDRKPL